jgi:hypothetical protein
MILHHKSKVIFYKKHNKRMPVIITLRTVVRTAGGSLFFTQQYIQHKPNPARAGNSHTLDEYEPVKSKKMTDSSIPSVPSFTLCLRVWEKSLSLLSIIGRQKGRPAHSDANTDILPVRNDITRYTSAVFFKELNMSFLSFLSIVSVLSQFLFNSFQCTFFKP